MPVNNLSPAYTVIEYGTPFGSHRMTLPTVPAFIDVDAIAKFDLRGLAAHVSCEVAIDAFIAVLRPFLGTTSIIGNYTVFRKPTPADVPIPIFAKSASLAGTGNAGVYSKSTQATITWRTTNFGIFKLVVLDTVVHGGVYERIVSPASIAAIQNMHNEVTQDVSFLAGRDEGRPETFLQAAFKLNDFLRKQRSQS